ncbi:MAG: hypothetical protein V4521_02410, partial [Pseudomonadota bacterium]
MQPDHRMCAELAGADTIFFAGYGARVGVRFADPDLGALLAVRPSPGTHLAAPGKVDRTLSVFRSGGRYWIYGDDEMKCQPERLADLLDAFDTHLRATFAEFSRKMLFVHAGVVGWNGRAIVFPGKSLAGKTTLVAELVKAGATYFSDEYAVLDKQGRVHPFAKPLSLRPSRTERQRETPVEALGGEAACKPLPVGLVVLTRYCDGAVWMPETLSPAEGVLAIMANTIAARRWPSLAVSVIGSVADRARFIRSDRGEA